jgi:hypothetical protein
VPVVEVAADDEEHLDAEKASRHPRDLGVVEEDCQHRDRAKAIDAAHVAQPSRVLFAFDDHRRLRRSGRTWCDRERLEMRWTRRTVSLRNARPGTHKSDRDHRHYQAVVEVES